MEIKDYDKFFLNENLNSFDKDIMRIPGIIDEFINGFKFFRGKEKMVTAFGSARFFEGSPWYQKAVELAQLLGKSGYSIVTGGGPGMMEAANRGASEVGAPSYGVNIELEMEQEPNKFMDEYITMRHFFVRKVLLVKYSMAFVIFPGGFGTMDELAETLTLIQTKKLQNFPIILVGKEYWQGFYSWVKETMLLEGAISSEDIDLIQIVDDPKKVVEIISKV